MHEIRQQRLAGALSDRLGGFIRDALSEPSMFVGRIVLMKDSVALQCAAHGLLAQ